LLIFFKQHLHFFPLSKFLKNQKGRFLNENFENSFICVNFNKSCCQNGNEFILFDTEKKWNFGGQFGGARGGKSGQFGTLFFSGSNGRFYEHISAFKKRTTPIYDFQSALMTCLRNSIYVKCFRGDVPAKINSCRYELLITL
jgi:hypothetical protein